MNRLFLLFLAFFTMGLAFAQSKTNKKPQFTERVINSDFSDGDIILRISATELQYSFWFQKEGEEAELLGSAATKDISTELIDGFIGAYIGMYASGNGKANTNPADFDWFDFEEDPEIPYEWTLNNQKKNK